MNCKRSLGIRDYGALQGILMTPVQILQAASPFVAALLWQWSGGYELLTYVLLGFGDHLRIGSMDIAIQRIRVAGWLNLRLLQFPARRPSLPIIKLPSSL